MSENPQSNTTQALPGDGEELYHPVWCEPVERITSLYSTSKEQLTKRYVELRIPRPFIGYWRALVKGTVLAAPALPDLKSGKVVKPPGKTSQDIPLPTKISPKVTVPVSRKWARTAGNDYVLIDDLRTCPPVSSVTKDGYYKPTKKKPLNLNILEAAFNSAIDFLSRFFAAPGKRGYWVRLAEGNEGLHCKDIDIEEDPKEGGSRYDSL